MNRAKVCSAHSPASIWKYSENRLGIIYAVSKYRKAMGK